MKITVKLGRWCVFLSLFLLQSSASSQEVIDVDSLAWSKAMDSLASPWNKSDSLVRADSIALHQELSKLKQFAAMREVDLTGDGVNEVLRIDTKMLPDARKMKVEFTIRSGKKILYRDSWKASGYFDPKDKLTSLQLKSRLRRIVTVFFANENFSVLDGAGFELLLENVSHAEIKPGSQNAKAIFAKPKVMFSTFRSRDLWYGLVWEEAAKKFVKAWMN